MNIENTYVMQMRMKALQSVKKGKEINTINEELKEIKETDLNEIVWIWAKTKINLIQAWITTVEKLKSLSKEKIMEIIKNPISQNQIFTFLNI